MKAKYINPFTDFGFKKIFGEQASKELLIDFLNALIPQANKIIDLNFKNTEHLGQKELDRNAIFDIYCENQSNEKFIVELQKAKQNYFRERTIYYSTFPIREQAEKGEWNYNLNAVFCIGILDFTFNDYESEPEKSEVVHTIKLKNQHGNTFYEKLTYIYIEMPNFNKLEDNLSSRLDKWLFFIKNLEDFQSIPSIFSDEIFEKAFEKAELAKFGQEEMDKYESSLKLYRDLKGVIDTAFIDGRSEGKIEGLEEGRQEGLEEGRQEGLEEGRQEGLEEGRLEGLEEGRLEGLQEGKYNMAKLLKDNGVQIQLIIQTTGLTREEIDLL
jgi:predicted transposase/invertase (TIGR01784 family)